MTDENMTGPDAEGVDWGPMESPESVATWTPDDGAQTTGGRASYPEHPPLAEAPISINFRITGEPQITVRGHDAAQINATLAELESYGVWANIANAMASLRAQGAIGNGLGPVSPAPAAPAPQAPPAPPYGAPATPPPFGPNVSVPAAPGYQGPPPGQYQQAPQSGGWGGGRSSGPQEKPRPAGWAMVDVPFNDKDRFKALRAQGTESGNYLRGKVQWGGKGVYWLDPSVAGWLAQQGFPVTQ